MARAHIPAPPARPGTARPRALRPDQARSGAGGSPGSLPSAGTATHQTATSPSARAGFVLYVGLQGDSAALDAQHAADLAEVAEALRDLARDLLPTAETFTALSLMPGPSGPDDVQSLRARLSELRPFEADPRRTPHGTTPADDDRSPLSAHT